ncbi:ER membrane protein complex subunit 10-like [Tubulanus polymorphus]|uniref:ER membrane protein complex subunit 10-like n=1 Tax=Tubulanus polymorphus TaxID=672921 RepID=UPI003DA3E366
MAAVTFRKYAMNLFVFWVFLVLFNVAGSTSNIDEGEEEFENLFTLPLEHSLGTDGPWIKHGFITIRSMTNNLAQFTQIAPFTVMEKDKLKKLSRDDGVYRIRVPVKYTNSEPMQYVSSFIKACSLYESHLSDEVTLTVDMSGNVNGVSMVTNPSVCTGVDDVEYSSLNDFNRTIEIRQTVQGPVPDTQSYVQKMEQEKAEKAKGQQADNRSFLAKYWMYIVPVALLLMVASASDPGQGR